MQILFVGPGFQFLRWYYCSVFCVQKVHLWFFFFVQILPFIGHWHWKSLCSSEIDFKANMAFTSVRTLSGWNDSTINTTVYCVHYGTYNLLWIRNVTLQWFVNEGLDAVVRCRDVHWIHSTVQFNLHRAVSDPTYSNTFWPFLNLPW